MSLTIASTSNPFDDDIDLDAISTSSGDLQGHEVHDFTKVPFYKKATFIRTTTMIASAVLSMAMFYYGFTHIDRRPVGSWLKGLDAFCMIAPWILGPIGIAVGYFYKGYQDPADRYRFRSELLDGTITLNEFVSNHGWENIRRWGFFIPEDQEPLCTKAQMAGIILNSAKQSQLDNFFETYEYVEDIHIVSNQYVTITYYFYYYAPSLPVLWEAISHKIFSEQEKDELNALFEKNVFRMRGTEVLNNWRFMKEIGENTNPKLDKLYDWLEKNEARYQMLTKAYRQRANFFIGRIGEGYNALRQDFDTNLPEVPQEILDSMPAFEDGWFTGINGHIKQLDDLNAWFVDEQAKIDDEFSQEFAAVR